MYDQLHDDSRPCSQTVSNNSVEGKILCTYLEWGYLTLGWCLGRCLSADKWAIPSDFGSQFFSGRGTILNSHPTSKVDCVWPPSKQPRPHGRSVEDSHFDVVSPIAVMTSDATKRKQPSSGCEKSHPSKRSKASCNLREQKNPGRADLNMNRLCSIRR